MMRKRREKDVVQANRSTRSSRGSGRPRCSRHASLAGQRQGLGDGRDLSRHLGRGVPQHRRPRAQEGKGHRPGARAPVCRRSDCQGPGGTRCAAVRRLRARSGPARFSHRAGPVREVRRVEARQRQQGPGRICRCPWHRRQHADRRHRLQPQEAAKAEKLERPVRRTLRLALGPHGLPDHVRHRVADRDRQGVRRNGHQRRARPSSRSRRRCRRRRPS